MTRSSLALLGLIGGFALLVGSPPAEGNPAGELRIIFKGLPEGDSYAVLVLSMIHLEDGMVTEVVRADPPSEISVDAPEGRLTFRAMYFSPVSRVYLLGTGTDSTLGDGAVEIIMRSPQLDPAPDPSPLQTYPPAEGMTLGYDPVDFIAEGPSSEPWWGEALAGVVITALSQSHCADSDVAPYQIVESANPKALALIEAELELQADPSFDPASRVTPHIIAATHLVKGSFRLGADSLVADLRVEDREGNVIAHAAVSGSVDSLIETAQEAARALADQLCEKPPLWRRVCPAQRRTGT